MAQIVAVALFALTAVLLIRASSPTSRRKAGPLLAGAAALVLVGLSVYGQPWIGMSPLVGGVAMLLLPIRFGLPLAVVSVASSIVVQWMHDPADLVALLGVTTGGVLAVLEIFGVARAAHLIVELDEARDELAAAAVTDERARFAEDLDGLLVRRLAMIRVRCSAVLAGHHDARAPVLDETLHAIRDLLVQLRAAARQYRGPAAARPVRDPQEPARYTKALTYVLLTSFVGLGSVFILFREPHPSGWALATAELSMLIVGVGQVLLVERFDRIRGRMAWALLAGQLAILLAPALLFEVRAGLFYFVSATAVLVLTGAKRWWVFGAVVVIDATVRDSTGWPRWAFLDGVANTIILTMVVAATTIMVRAARELAVVRQELAAAAVLAERTRFARDLHDLIGHSLSAIALKTELAQRLMRADPARAEQEISEVRDIARTAITDARALTGGPGLLELDRETRSAAELLCSADVEVHIDLQYGQLPTEIGSVLAAVVREDVTNVLRHGGGARCSIHARRTVGTVKLVIENDALVTSTDDDGSGLGNLAERVAAVDGLLAAAPASDGTFRLEASIPLTVPRQGAFASPRPIERGRR